jgi:hypothetical protein
VVHVAVHLLPLALSEQVQAGFWGMAGLVVLGLPVQAAQQAKGRDNVAAHASLLSRKVSGTQLHTFCKTQDIPNVWEQLIRHC